MNQLRRRISEGSVVVGHMLTEFAFRGSAMVVKAAGVDFVVFDMEHGGVGVERIADQMAWFKATPVAPLVRVPAADYQFIARSLDIGALGIMIPNVESPEQAQRVVAAVKYAPEGKRGLGLGVAHNDYVPPNPGEYLKEANAATVVICQIESVESLSNLDRIASVPGVDVLWVGQFDLTSSMGIVGEFQNPRFLDALATVSATARRHGKAAGIQPGNREQAAAWLRLGYTVISLGSDIHLYRNALTAEVDALRALDNAGLEARR